MNTWKRELWLYLGMAVLAWSCTAAAAADVVRLVSEDGRMRAAILLAEDADELEVKAARELSEHLALIADASPEEHRITAGEVSQRVAALQDQGQTPIVLGTLTIDSLRSSIEQANGNDEAFALHVEDGMVHVAGLSPHGTLFGTYELLEQVGFRWFMPGELGRTLPLDDDEPVLAEQLTVQTPSFRGRIFRDDTGWAKRNRLGGDAPPMTLNMPSVGTFEEHPDRYAMVDGERTDRQLCVSNPETLAAMIDIARRRFANDSRWLALGTHGGSHCECDGCRELDPPGTFGPFTGGINVTDRYIRFANQVLDAVEDAYPGHRISLQFATGHILPPANEVGHPNLSVVGWPVGYCRIHGDGNPICPERLMVGQHTRQWVQHLEGNYYERTSWGNVAGPGFLFPLVHRYRRELPAYHAYGVSGFRISPYSNWISENPSAYIAARLLWNHEADVDALLADFYRRYYGPAAASMQAYHELIEHTAEHADHHTGSAFDMTHIYPIQVREQAREHLEAALTQADEEIYQRRIAPVVSTLDYLNAFVEMMEKRNHHDYAGSVDALERAHAINNRLRNDYEFPLLMNRTAHYLDHFFGNTIRAAHERTSEPGELVVGLDDQWQFQLDPERIGETLQLHRPTTTGGNWRPIKTASSSWSNQGLHYYRGDAWYRQTVDLPDLAGQRLMLWIGGVDEQARVWVNGHELGDNAGDAFRPFEFEVTDAVQSDASNAVVIRVSNNKTDEVGTGGLVGPVMFYTPGESD